MTTKNLLVVDDSATTRMLISLTLKKGESFNIIEASNGSEAVARLDSESVDMVLTDINMPEMNGLELISHIRSQHSKQNIPIIVITTMGEESDRDKGLSLGANAYILKPISGAKLQSLVEELLA
jgi:two-component system chemotaxis response regulator CheY